MARLIDADSLLEKIQFRLEMDNEAAKLINGCVYLTRRIIGNEPAIDAVPVIRCHNCQHSEPCKPHKKVWCPRMGRYMKDDAFCSEGVMKDG